MGATCRIAGSCISGLALPGMLGLLHCSVRPGPACQGFALVGTSAALVQARPQRIPVEGARSFSQSKWKQYGFLDFKSWPFDFDVCC